MKGVLITIGIIGTLAVVVFLMTRKPDMKKGEPPKAKEEKEGSDTKKEPEPDIETKIDPNLGRGSGTTTGGGKVGSIVGGVLGEIEDILITVPEPATPEPETTGPDPFTPTPVPTPGYYYQVVKDDTIWDLCKVAYGAGWKWETIIKPTGEPGGMNNWIRKTGNASWSGKGLYPRYSGWNTEWDSGHQFPVVYFPVEE